MNRVTPRVCSKRYGEHSWMLIGHWRVRCDGCGLIGLLMYDGRVKTADGAIHEA